MKILSYGFLSGFSAVTIHAEASMSLNWTGVKGVFEFEEAQVEKYQKK